MKYFAIYMIMSSLELFSDLGDPRWLRNRADISSARGREQSPADTSLCQPNPSLPTDVGERSKCSSLYTKEVLWLCVASSRLGLTSFPSLLPLHCRPATVASSLSALALSHEACFSLSSLNTGMLRKVGYSFSIVFLPCFNDSRRLIKILIMQNAEK